MKPTPMKDAKIQKNIQALPGSRTNELLLNVRIIYLLNKIDCVIVHVVCG